MNPVMTALIWTLIAGVVAAGFLGSALNAIPVTGVLVAPLLVLVVLRHGRVGLVLLLGGLTGRLPIASWLEAHEVAEACRRDVLLAALPAMVFGLLQLPALSASQQLSAAGHAMLPLLLAVGVRVVVFTPLSIHLRSGHTRWIAALKEALTPPVLLPVLPSIPDLPTPQRTVA